MAGTCLDWAERECLLQIAEAHEVGIAPRFVGSPGLAEAAARLRRAHLVYWAEEPPDSDMESGWCLTEAGEAEAKRIRGRG